MRKPSAARSVAFAALVLSACGSAPRLDDMVYVPAGEFPMGSAADDGRVYQWEKPREQPQHPVFLDAFNVDRHEVTNAEYERFDPKYKRNAQYSPCDDCPVVEVSWTEAQAYCAAQQPPKRLPTEAEWEKAAKGGAPWTPEPFTEYAWYAGNSIRRAQPVMKKRPNPFGLYDMLGNVREWTADWYDPGYYQQRVAKNPKGPEAGQRRVERGGAFFLPQAGVTPTIRYNQPPDFHLYFLGFRCARSG
jgi:formylglycine-generating enzyme required for sulfatase activity